MVRRYRALMRPAVARLEPVVDVPPASDVDADVLRISERKREHLELAASPRSQALVAPGWDDVHLIPSSLPELSPGDVDLTTDLLGHRLAAPLVLVPMTGGHPDAAQLNAVLGEAAERLGLAVGVGSQRAALRQPSLAATFTAVRRRAPHAVVLANIGACQLVAQGDEPAVTAADLREVVRMVDADVLTIHLNVVQELVQTEGDRVTGPLAHALAEAVALSPVPVVAKETGAGLTAESARALVAAGVAGLDVGGAGGTSFARIEAARAADVGDGRGARLGAVFGDWGVPTAPSVLEVRHLGVPVIATGGIRHGLDAARALALGATAVGVGRLAITAAMQGVAALEEELGLLLEELRTALVLSGARTPADLADHRPVLTGFTLEWARQRGVLPGA